MQRVWQGMYWVTFLIENLFFVSVIGILSLVFIFRVVMWKWMITREKRRSEDGSVFGNTSSASVVVGKFEVFLSFRGIDTRKGFTDCLYNNLVDAGIRTFKDDDELPVGEEIRLELKKAIEESKICIPIFSKNYASSKWCLLELAQMVECKRSTEQKIKPIFYDVEPRDVRKQTGSYEEAFRQHEKRFDKETVQRWKEALKEVGELKGWELQKETNGYQGKLVKMVVEEVLSQLKKNDIVVTGNLVGIDHHIEEMKRLLNVDSNDVRIVGIYGMGGLGKTTIAKFVYKELSECFDCCCFLVDVREKAQQDSGLVDLQKKLIFEIRKGKVPDIANVDVGINMIEDMACKKKVLIVLDDVDKESQFAKLVGNCNWFGSGSRIIVTTRNKGVPNMEPVYEAYKPQPMELVYEAYEPQPMEPHHALQLFSRHAFRSDFPPEGYHNLSKKVVSTTGELPLALEIIGSLFCRERRKKVWKETLKKLTEIPNDEVQKKLRISYEALEYEEKQIFLDIACFFIGENKTLPFYMWDDSKYYPTIGINILVLRSLVKIGDDNEFRMHDQLRDLGREIVRQQNIKNPGERSRLWRYDEISEMLDRQMGTNKVEALLIAEVLLIAWGRSFLTNDKFGKLPNLRFLRVDGRSCLTGDFNNLLSELRWLQWNGCSDDSKPINFHLKNLIILVLSRSKVTKNWEGWSQIKMAKKLKVLDLSFCNDLTITPDFSTFVSLERLILKDSGNLVEIGPSIGNLINLRVLDISGSGIRKLPDAIGGLEKLKELYASSCRHFDGVIPSTIGRLSSLRILMLDSTLICSLPMSICGLTRLQTLDLTLGRLQTRDLTLELTLRRLQTLQTLDLTLARLQTRDLTLDLTLGRLQALDLTLGRDFLQSLPELPPSLRSLRLEYYFMETLPSLSNLTKLSHLKLFGCHKLKEIQGLERLESLRYLEASECESLERFLDLSNLVMLKRLHIWKCYKLVEVRGLTGLKFLEKLDMRWCISLEILPDLSNMGMLKILNLFRCGKLAEVGGLTGLKSLEKLDMSWCVSLEILPDLSNMGMLKILNLFRCEKLAEVGGLGGLKSLEILNMSGCNLFERLLDLSNLKNLKKLEIRGWKNLTEVQGLEELESLEILDIFDCRLLEKSLDLSNLKKLKDLKAGGCENLPEIRGLEELESLKILDISGCRLLEKSLDLSNLQKLKELKAGGCENLPEIQGLEELESLRILDISGCEAIEKLPAIEELPNLSFTLIVTGPYESTIRADAASSWAEPDYDSDIL